MNVFVILMYVMTSVGPVTYVSTEGQTGKARDGTLLSLEFPTEEACEEARPGVVKRTGEKNPGDIILDSMCYETKSERVSA